MDLILSGGTVIDGSGQAPFVADVAIERGRIAVVGQLNGMAARQTLNASGAYVTPGFIDIHSHSDFTLLVDPRAFSSITQGVTCEVIGNCGHGCAPIDSPDLVKGNIYGWSEFEPLDWRTMRGYLARLESKRPAVNVMSLAPNGNLRLAAVGAVARPSTPDEVRRMEAMLAEAMDEGACGYSTGLEYSAERDCSPEEIEALCRVAAKRGGFYATHTRNLDGQPLESIHEAISAARNSGVPLQISHLGVVARLTHDSRGAVERSLDLIEEARREGLDVTFDMHTRAFGTTNLSCVLPSWALEGDTAEIAGRLRNPSVRKLLKSTPNIISALARSDWNQIVIFQNRIEPELSQRSIQSISNERGTDPLDTSYDILLTSIERIHDTMILSFCYNPDDLRAAFEHPQCMVGSDATALAPTGVLADQSFHGAYTWAGCFWRHFVRERRSMSPEEAVRRITSLPAARLGLSDRGVLRPGACADIAVFDGDVFSDTGTTFEPNQQAHGMRHVLVNGVLSLLDGELTGQRGGQVIRAASLGQ